jgi:hypothetical protein
MDSVAGLRVYLKAGGIDPDIIYIDADHTTADGLARH